MGLLVAEGFDDAKSGTNEWLINKQYWSGAYISSASSNIAVGAGRYGGQAIGSNNTFQQFWTWTLPAGISEIFLCVAIVRTGSATNEEVLIRFKDGASTQIDIRHTGSTASDLKVTRNGTQLGNTVSNVFAQNVWTWLSVRVVIHPTNGLVEIRNASGSVIFSVSGVNTQATANAYVTAVDLGANSGGGFRHDDLFIMDTAGATFNGHLTERSIRTVFPNADGDTLQWAANGAANRWDCVDEVSTDNDTTYLSSSTAGQTNLSNLQNLPSSVQQIEGVIWQHRSRKDEVGTREVRGVIKTGGTVYNGSTKNLSSTYTNYADLWELNPNTGTAWTPTEVNALQGGIQVVT